MTFEVKNPEIVERFNVEFSKFEQGLEADVRFINDFCLNVLTNTKTKLQDAADHAVASLKAFYGWVKEIAQKVWAAIVRFFEMCWKGVKAGAQKVSSVFKKEGESRFLQARFCSLR